MRGVKLHVIIGSTRPGRAGLPIAQWFLASAQRYAGFESSLVDLAEVDLPLLDEPEHPRFQRYTREHTKRWSAIVQAADAFVFVVPEYNYSVPPALLNAIDYLAKEWAYKPAAFVSYGGIAAGTRSVQMLKLTLTALRMMPVPDAVHLPFFNEHLKEGRFHATEGNDKAASAMLVELERWAKALKTLRE